MPRAFGLRIQLQFTYVLDIDAAVGKNCPNRKDDVYLVQYLLAVWQAHERNTTKLLPLLRGTKPMVADGICGSNTLAVIKSFEDFHQPTVNTDGRIDPFVGKAQKMFLLNQLLFFAGGLRGGVPQTRIPIPFPAHLVGQLFRP